MRGRRGGRGSGYVSGVRGEDPRQLLLDVLSTLDAPGPTFGELAIEWLRSIERVCPENECRHVRHMLSLHALRARDLTVAAVDAVIRATKLGPSTQNKLRSTGKLVVDWAQANGKWRAPNPFALLRRRRETRRVYNTLTAEEATRVLQVEREDPLFLRMVHVAVLTGARPGELAALLPEDVDLSRNLMIVRRSHERNQTKTGRERLFAIPRCARRPIEAGLHDCRELGCRFVFPSSRTGERRGRHSKISTHFRHLLDKAGIDRPITFYDLRHTAATLHREAGADPLAIRLALGHANRNLTDDLYTHLSVAYLAKELGRLCVCGKCRPPVVCA